jgi:Holliday junction DNA helicase RuvA
MITFLEGILVEKQTARVVVDVHGVGYEAAIPLSSYDRLPAEGQPVHIFVHDYVREDAHLLFGFVTEQERRMFNLLMGASGVGPKTALSALSGMPVRDLMASIAGSDVKRLSSVSGIGKKLAERIVVELRDRMSKGEALEAMTATGSAESDAKLRDVMLALIALGYRQDAARKMVADAVRNGIEKMSVEDVVRKALSSE